MTVARSLRALPVAAALALLAPLARADDAPPRRDDRARAQQLFDDALEDAKKGDFKSACPKFQASQLADPKASTLLNLANCYEKNGQTASAWGAFREAAVLARKTSHPDWEASATERAAALEPTLLRFTVTVPEASRVDGLVVTRDGAKLSAGEWGVSIPVDPGEHVITATAPKKKPWEERVRVTEAVTSVTVPLLEDEPQAPPPVEIPGAITSLPKVEAPPPAPVYWTPLRKIGAGVAAAGVVGVGASLVVGLVASGRQSDAEQQCRDGVRGCPPAAVSDSDYAYSLATAATVVFVVGAAALAAGGAIFLLAPSEAPTKQARAPRRWVAVTPGGVTGAF